MLRIVKSSDYFVFVKRGLLRFSNVLLLVFKKLLKIQILYHQQHRLFLLRFRSDFIVNLVVCERLLSLTLILSVLLAITRIKGVIYARNNIQEFRETADDFFEEIFCSASHTFGSLLQSHNIYFMHRHFSTEFNRKISQN